MVQTRSQTRAIKTCSQTSDIETDDEVDVTETKYSTCGWKLVFDDDSNYFVVRGNSNSYIEPGSIYYEFLVAEHRSRNYDLALACLREKSIGRIINTL